MKVKPLPDRVLADKFLKGERKTVGGIILRDDDGTTRGIRCRWARVYDVGNEINYIRPGQWIYIKHGRWSHGVKITDDTTIWQIDPEGIIALSDEQPTDDMIVDTDI